MKRSLISDGKAMEKFVGFSRAVKVGLHVSLGGTSLKELGPV